MHIGNPDRAILPDPLAALAHGGPPGKQSICALRISPDLRREQIEPDTANLSAGDPQLRDRQGRRERVGQSAVSCPPGPSRSRQGPTTARCASNGNHLIGRLDINGRQPFDPAARDIRRFGLRRLRSPSFRETRGGAPRQSVALVSTAMMRRTGQPARRAHGSGSRFRRRVRVPGRADRSARDAQARRRSAARSGLRPLCVAAFAATGRRKYGCIRGHVTLLSNWPATFYQ